MNAYEQNNKTYFDELKSLVETSKKWALQVNAKGKKRLLDRGHAPKYAHLRLWIDEVTPMLSDPFYTAMTKAYWILHGIENWDNDLVRCKNCGKSFKDKNVRNVYAGYFEFCSPKCASSFGGTKQKVRNTNGKRYGGHPSRCAETQTKSKKTRLERYGDENWNNVEKTLNTRHERFGGRYAPADHAEKCRKTKVANGHSANWNNGEQAIETRRKANGGAYESDAAKEKRRATCMDRFGVEYAFQSDFVKGESRQTCFDKYGVEHYNQTEEFKEHSKATCMDRYGVEYSVQCHDIRKKGQKRYVFENQTFDSATEIEFFVYMRDCGYKIIKDPGVSFEYEFSGKTHVYFPDFMVISPYGAVELIEIKGDQFFREDGTMFCPYRDNEWTDEQYAEKCALYEAKHQCMLGNGVKILRYNSDYMKFVRSRVAEKYGAGYAKQFRNS